MSWQRVLNLAQRSRMPVIVSDVAGREPYVVLSLEAYERLIEGDQAVLSQSAPSPAKTPEQARLAEERVAVGLETLAKESVAEESSFEPVKNSKEVVIEVVEMVALPAEKKERVQEEIDSELRLEERFYLEPAEDGV